MSQRIPSGGGARFPLPNMDNAAMPYQITARFYSPQPTEVLVALLRAKYDAHRVSGTFQICQAPGEGDEDYRLCTFTRDAAHDRDRVYARLDPSLPVTVRSLVSAVGWQLFEELVAGDDDIRLRPIADAALHLDFVDAAVSSLLGAQ